MCGPLQLDFLQELLVCLFVVAAGSQGIICRKNTDNDSPHGCGANIFTSTPWYCVGYHRQIDRQIDRYKLVTAATRGTKGQEEECEGRNDNLGWLPNELFDMFLKK